MRDRLIEKVLYEMACSAGDGSDDDTSYLNSHANREKIYRDFKDSKLVGPNLYMRANGNTVEYATLNHQNEHATHHAVYKLRTASYRNIPFDHYEQVAVNAVKGAHRNRSVEVMHHHVLNSEYPLVSSYIQTDQGHAMWKKFIEHSLDYGLHCSYLENGIMHPIDKSNLDHYHRKYFGDTLHHEETNLVVSKNHIS